MPEYRVNYSQQPSAAPDPMATGAQWGKAIGGIARGAQSIADEAKREGLPFGLMEGTKAKADKLIADYGNPDSEIFAGLTGSQRTTKLVSLLQPLDSEMAKRYETRADEERTKDFGGSKAKVPTAEPTGNLDADIASTKKAIEDIKDQLRGAETATEDKGGAPGTAPAGTEQGAQTEYGKSTTDAAPEEGARTPDQNSVGNKPGTPAPEVGAKAPVSEGDGLQTYAPLDQLRPLAKFTAGQPTPPKPETLLESMGGTYGTGTETPLTLAAAYGTQGLPGYGQAPFIAPSAPRPKPLTLSDIYGNGTLSGRDLTKADMFDTRAALAMTPSQIEQQKMQGYKPGDTLHGYLPANAGMSNFAQQQMPGETWKEMLARLDKEAKEYPGAAGTEVEDNNGY